MSDITNSAPHWLEARIASGSAVATPSAIADLDHSALTGTPDNTLADIATADAALEADLKDIGAKVNAILAALRTLGIITT